MYLFVVVKKKLYSIIPQIMIYVQIVFESGGFCPAIYHKKYRYTQKYEYNNKKIKERHSIMSDFEKDLYKQMSSAERVWMYLIKYAELLELIDLMTDQDEEGLRRVLQYLKK